MTTRAWSRTVKGGKAAAPFAFETEPGEAAPEAGVFEAAVMTAPGDDDVGALTGLFVGAAAG